MVILSLATGTGSSSATLTSRETTGALIAKHVLSAAVANLPIALAMDSSAKESVSLVMKEGYSQFCCILFLNFDG
jgi:hypothetical protein